MHDLTGKCGSCLKLFNRYPDFHPGLQKWFEEIQSKYPDAHISCAGRGRIDQEIAYQKQASKAHFGESAHNFNAAIDIFQLEGSSACWYPSWFRLVVATHLTPEFKWYGAPDAKFFELPHVEVSNWRELVKEGQLKTVE